jgi:hypothetical protein
MAPQSFLIVLAVVLSFAGPAVVVVVGQPYIPLGPYCSTTGNFTTASDYQVNLGDLMSSLPQSAIANRGFDKGSSGQAPDEVFGLIMCYADRNWTQCQNCLRAAAAGVQQICPFSREMKACYDACVVQYSNVSFFSVADLTVAFYVWADALVTDMASMNATRWSLMTRLAEEAAGNGNSLRLANGSQAYTDSQGSSHVMYGLAQCTRDLNGSECARCLAKFVAELSSSRPNNTYGTVKGYSCYVAYKIDESLGITIPPDTAAPPRPPPSPTTVQVQPPG